ncbi:hypothetical protein EVAR_100235_1 [Eumeta japonica]|uniref:Uncharacterized protein n=1 Tax=Eumeta variegata TaxID=151549 RepID=A0A4C1ZUT4_EUMVA|nr:hypothetical protein EVAR_100235_1 [Eumeta japonica]
MSHVTTSTKPKNHFSDILRGYRILGRACSGVTMRFARRDRILGAGMAPPNKHGLTCQLVEYLPALLGLTLSVARYSLRINFYENCYRPSNH